MIFESCLDLCVECSISSCLICLYLVQFLIVCENFNENFKHQIPSGVIKQCYPLQHLQGDVHGKITELNGNFSTSDV